MDWNKRMLASVATWGVLAHRELGQINPTVTPYEAAEDFPLEMLAFYDPGASKKVKQHKAYALAGEFVSYVVHFYQPLLETGHTSADDYRRKLKNFAAELTDLLAAPEKKTLKDLAAAVDKFFRFRDEPGAAQ